MSTTLADLALERARRTDPPAQARRATIRTSAQADTDELYVTLEQQPGYRRGPCRGWAAHGATLPQDGDTAVVTQTDAKDWWIIAWWPKDAAGA